MKFSLLNHKRKEFIFRFKVDGIGESLKNNKTNQIWLNKVLGKQISEQTNYSICF